MIFEFTIRQIKRFKRLILLFASGMVILVFLTFLTTAPDRAPQKSESIKGVWLTHVGNAFLTYASLTDNVFYQHKEHCQYYRTMQPDKYLHSKDVCITKAAYDLLLNLDDDIQQVT